MSNPTDRFISLLEPYGLSEDEVRVYLFLLTNQAQPALKISRQLSLPRTRVYRILDKLIIIGLVTKELSDRGLKFEGQSYQKLDMIISEKESQIEALKRSKDSLYSMFATITNAQENDSQILYYQGIEGLKQVTWNSIKAKNMLYIYEIADMSAFLDYGFSEKVREEFVQRKVYTKELTNQTSYEGWTKVKEQVKSYWQCRHIAPQSLTIEFEVMIYNDVYVLYNYKDGEIFCVEIYNSHLAKMQKQIFEFIWQQATPMKILNEFGKAEV